MDISPTQIHTSLAIPETPEKLVQAIDKTLEDAVSRIRSETISRNELRYVIEDRIDSHAVAYDAHRLGLNKIHYNDRWTEQIAILPRRANRDQPDYTLRAYAYSKAASAAMNILQSHVASSLDPSAPQAIASARPVYHDMYESLKDRPVLLEGPLSPRVGADLYKQAIRRVIAASGHESAKQAVDRIAGVLQAHVTHLKND